MKTFGKWAIGGTTLLLAACFFYSKRQVPDSSSTEAASASAATQAAVPLAKQTVVQSNASVPAVPQALAQSTGESFTIWAKQFSSAPESARPALLAKGEALARERSAYMAELVRNNPQRALAESLPYSVRQQLPASVLALIEQPLSERGEFRPVCHTPAPGNETHAARHTYEVVVNKQRMEAFTYGERLAQPPQQGSYLHGITVTGDDGKKIVALSDDILRRVTDRTEVNDLARAGKIKHECDLCRAPVVQPEQKTVVEFGGAYVTTCNSSHAAQLEILMKAAHGSIWASGGVASNPPDVVIPPNSSGTQGLKKLLYIRVLFADDPAPPESDDDARDTVEDNNRYFFEGSYGKVWWDNAVTPLVRLPQRKNFYGENPGALLNDAAAGAAALGYFASDYYSPHYVLHNNLAQYSFGGLSSGILNASPGALIHELGHNFGLPHANFWQPEGRDPGPRQPTNAPPYPIDPDSALGHNALDAPYMTVRKPEPMEEYGNFHDVMGSGGGHFSTMFKNRMHWLPNQYIKDVITSTTNRIYAFDTPAIYQGRLYAMRVRKDVQREYWLSYRQGNPGNRWFSNGIEVTWNFGNSMGPFRGFGDNELIDTTPGSSYHKQDAALVVGRTLNDRHANVYITPIGMGGGPAGSNKWIDVVVHTGHFTNNQRPTFTLNASATAVPIGADVAFTAVAQDPDGDQLAYHWDFGDHTFGSNFPVQSKRFPTNGNYVVRCEVSDMKGGVTSAHVLVTVGTPNTFTVTGRVLDSSGNPVQGVRVHNCGVKPTSPGANATDLGTYRYGFTDSDGYYIIGNVPPGVYTNRAFIFGYRTEPYNFADPMRLEDGNANGLDFIATPVTRVAVTRSTDADEAGTPGAFTISRYKPDADYSDELPVRFRASGSATLGSHYTINVAGEELTTNQIVIPAGSASVDVNVMPVGDADGDGGKDAVLTLLLQTNFVRILTVASNMLVTNNGVVFTNAIFVQQTNRYSVPGWELRPVGPLSTLTWFQTDPTYVIEGAEATVRINDDDPAGVPVVSLFTLDGDAVESRADSATIMVIRSGAPITSNLTVKYAVEGVASNGIDVVLLPGTITIPAGQYYTMLSVTAVDDLFVEGHEYLQISLLPAPAGEYTPGLGGGGVTVVDDDLPEVSIFASTATASRGGTSGRLTVSRSGSTVEDLTVNYLVTGTAVGGVDYNVLTGAVVIPANQLSADISIVPIASSTNPLPRTVTLLVSDSTTYDIFTRSATVTIVDSALPSVTLSASGDAVAEGSAGSFTITRNGSTTNSLRVWYDVGGSAWEGIDYSFLGNFVDIPAGAASAVISFNTINDIAREVGDTVGNETIIVQLRTAANYFIGNPSGRTVRITDDDGSNFPAVGFMLASSTVREDAGLAVMYVKVSANPATNRPIQLEYRVTGGSAVQGVNYINSFGGSGRTGILDIIHYRPPTPPPDPNFFDYENGIYAIQLPILNSTETIGDRTVTLSLFNPTRYQTNVSWFTNNGVTYSNVMFSPVPTNFYLGPSVTHTLTILDVGQSSVSVAASSDYLYESGGVPQRFIVTRGGPTNAPLTVNYVLSGTASAGSDYSAPLVQSVVIPAGTNAASVSILPLNDPTEEMAESIIMTLLTAPGYGISGGRARMTLVSDDGTVQFLLSRYEAVEGSGIANIAVIRTGNTNISSTVDYTVADGTAVSGADYVPTNGVITFAPGETLREIQVTLIVDELVEQSETISLSLSNPSGGVDLGGQRTATLAIVNDDTELLFAEVLFLTQENAGVATVEILRNGDLSGTNLVTFVAATNTAGASDFVPMVAVVEFLPGQTNARIDITVNDDAITDGNELALLQISGVTGGASLSLSNALLVILDDECSVDFAATSFTGNEYSNSVTLVLRRLGGTVNPVSVQYTAFEGTASNGVDFIATSGAVTFAGDRFELDTNGTGQLFFVPGDTTQTITIPLIDDQLGEGNEMFRVVLSNATALVTAMPGSVVLGTNVEAAVTIRDNETPGNVDYEYAGGSGPNGPVHAVALDYLERAVIGGEFTSIDGIAYNRIARLHANGQYDASFNPGAGADGTVFAIAAAPDGKIYIGGLFGSVNGTNRTRIARLNGDGTLDLSFSTGLGANAAVRAIAVQSNGQVIIGGDFTVVNGANIGYLARLNANGSLDTNFAVTVSGPVNALAIEPDGQILVGGSFAFLNGSPRASLARVNPSGISDPAFSIGSGFNGPVRAIALQDDGMIVAGGSFTAFAGVAAGNIARMDANGLRDPSFAAAAGPNSTVRAVGVGKNGKIVVGGDFTVVGGQQSSRITRLQSDGSLDRAFAANSGANAPVRAVAVQADTAIVVGGDFTELRGIARNYVARLHGDERSTVTIVEFAGSNFTVLENAGTARVTILRSGSTNSAFSLTLSTANITATNGLDYVGSTSTVSFAVGQVRAEIDIAILDDSISEGIEHFELRLSNVPAGVDLTAGSTATVSIEDDENSVRFGATAYSAVEAASNAPVVVSILRSGTTTGELAVVVRTVDGSALNGSDYVAVSNTLVFAPGETSLALPIPIVDDGASEGEESFSVQLAVLNSSIIASPSNTVVTIQDNDPGPGSVDPSFNPGVGANKFVRAIAVQADGRIVIGGAFTNYANVLNRNHVARLDAYGGFDASFAPFGPNGIVTAIDAMPDGRIAIGGNFTNINGGAHSRLVRLTETGATDPLYDLGAKFDSAVAAVAIQPDGRIVAGGTYSTPTRGIARLRVNGSSDLSFDVGPGTDANVYSVKIQPDGYILAAGAFTNYGTFNYPKLIRLGANGLVDIGFNPVNIATGVIYSVAVAPDGKIVIGGSFRHVNGQSRSGVARLNIDGSLDSTFVPGLGALGNVYSVNVLTNGRVFVAGDFTKFNGVSAGRYVLLKPDGTIDAGFDSSVGADNTIYASAVQPDQRILIGGDFSNVNGIPRGGIARLNTAGADLQIISITVVNGIATFTVNSVPGQQYVLEATTGFTQWLGLSTNTASGTILVFTDPNAGSSAYRFYRVRREP